jgi:hypothetical protein
MHGKKKKRMQGIRAFFKIENFKKDCHPKGDHACCCFYCVKTKAQDQGLLKSVRSLFLYALACKGFALDCHPKGDHGNRRVTIMRFLPFAMLLVSLIMLLKRKDNCKDFNKQEIIAAHTAV